MGGGNTKYEWRRQEQTKMKVRAMGLNPHMSIFSSLIGSRSRLQKPRRSTKGNKEMQNKIFATIWWFFYSPV